MHMTKEEIRAFAQIAGKPVKLGGNLSNLSILNGWTEEMCEEYDKYFDNVSITADDFFD